MNDEYNQSNNPDVGENNNQHQEQPQPDQQQYQAQPPQPDKQPPYQGEYQQQQYQQPPYQEGYQQQYQQPPYQEGYQQQQYQQQPYGQPPMYGYNQKSKVAAGVLGILLGAIGVHNFYLGYTGKAIAQLLITVCTCGVGSFISGIWGLVEGIMILTGSINVDGNGVPLKD